MLCVSILIVNLDNTVLNVALPTLVRDLHARSHQLQWIVDAYALVYGGLVLVGGSLADRIGRKRTFMAGLAVFAGGSAWAAFSGSVGMLIAARASMGIGAAVMMPSTLSIITDMFREARAAAAGDRHLVRDDRGGVRARADHRRAAARALLVGIGVPDQCADRRVGFLFAIPLVPDSKNPASLRPDLTGAALSIAGLGLVLWSIIEAPVYGWSSALVIGVGAAGLAVLAGFTAWERFTSHPMLNLRFFREPSFSAPIGSLGLAMFGLVGSAVRAYPVPPVQPGVLPAPGRGQDAPDGGRDGGGRAAVVDRRAASRDQAHDRDRAAADRRPGSGRPRMPRSPGRSSACCPA